MRRWILAGGRQGYDDRGGEFSDGDQSTLPRKLAPDESLVSSVSKPEGSFEIGPG